MITASGEGMIKLPICICFVFFALSLPAQTPAALQLPAPFPLQSAEPVSIQQGVLPIKPFTVTGPRGALLGQQDGTFEAWIFPWKVLSGMRITADMKDYAVPIDVNEHAATIDVQPDHTTITFSHANFTIREVLFTPQRAPEGAGAFALFQIEAVRPMTLTFRFTPEMKRMWPALADDRPSAEWVKTGDSGFYLLHTNTEGQAAAIALPQSQPGILPPYQERPKNYPLEFVLHFDPKLDSHKIFPLLMTTADPGGTNASNSALAQRLHVLDASFEEMYRDTQSYYRTFLEEHLSIETPDERLNKAFTWAEIAINQLRVETTPSHAEVALVAGLYSSGDSSRPGFGWYFGRDSLWTLYAVNSYGDFKLSRDEMEFLLHRQSPEGKMPHEWSQTADLVDWKSRPYAYASADSTLLMLMAANDYLNVSGDKPFIEKHWDALERAWKFETSHDSDGDGIYENTEGTGWVESWIPTMPHQEIYLAALDQQASTAMSRLALATGHTELAKSAEARAKHIELQIEKEYLLPGGSFYAFSRNADGSVDSSPTIYPAVASWDGTYALHQAQPMLSRWASSEFSTDWGTRDLSPKVSFYDPISYHQGTVWPLFTGWVSLSEYRNGRSLAGYAHLMQNADLTWAQDPGAVTELLSGEYFSPLGRSTSHQLWSSAMVISPVMRGLFGVEWNAAANTLSVTPNLPADWELARLRKIPLGSDKLDLAMTREGTALVVRATGGSSQAIRLESHIAGVKFANGVLRIPLPAVEAGIAHGLPQPGSTTQQMKVIDQQTTANSITLKLSAPGGSRQSLFLRINDKKVKLHMDGAEATQEGNAALMKLQVTFAAGTGYVEKAVTFKW
jgi:glycogen debranching enzyme